MKWVNERQKLFAVAIAAFVIAMLLIVWTNKCNVGGPALDKPVATDNLP